MADDVVEQLRQIAVEHLGEAVRRVVDPVIGDSVLREVVGADLLGSLARADLAATILRNCFLLLAQFHLVEPRAQHLHGLRAVLDLRFLVLLGHDDAGRDVRDAHSRVRRVDALAARSARAERIDAQIFFVYLNVDFFGLGEHGHRCRRRVNPAARLGGRHALHAVHAALVFQLAVDTAPFDGRDHFLQSADARVARRHHFDAPALALRELVVHAEQLGREQRRFVAARAGADFGTSSVFSSLTSVSRRAVSDFSSSTASSRISASVPPASSSVCEMSRMTVLYSRKRSTTGSMSESALACLRTSDGSLCTSAPPRSWSNSSYRRSID